jgi:hypothetical protein
MIRKSTYTLLLILLVLAAVVVFLQRTPGLKTKTDILPTATDSPILLDLGGKTITAFMMSDDQGRILKAKLDSQNAWFIEQPSGCQYSSDNMAVSLSQIQTFKVLLSLETPLALADVGLTRPTYKLELTFNDGSTQSLKIGSIVPTGTGYYVQVNIEPVVVVSKYSIDSLFGLVSTACATPTPEPSVTPIPELTQTESESGTLTPEP